MKQVISIFLAAAAVTTALAGCGADAESEQDFSDSTIAGQVESISGSEVTLTLGTLTSGGMGGELPDDGEMPDMDGEGPGDREPPEDMELPDNGEMPDMDGEGPGDMEPPEDMELPDDGEMPDMDGEGPEDRELPEDMELPDDGEMPDMDGDFPGGGMGGGQTFEAGDETATLTIDESLIQTESGESADLDSIQEGTVLEIEFDSDNSITSVTIIRVFDGDGMGGEPPEDRDDADEE